MKFVFSLDPCPAPRMTQRDKWQPSKAASKYFSYRNHLCYQANLKSLETLPGTLNSLIFSLALPASWSKKKQDQMRGKPHEQTPDLDNLCKAFLDALCPTDQHIHSIGSMKKVWADFGSIELNIGESETQPETFDLFTNINSKI